MLLLVVVVTLITMVSMGTVTPTCVPAGSQCSDFGQDFAEVSIFVQTSSNT